MMPYVEHLCRAMDEQHYSHYDLHTDLWNGSLYGFLRKEYRRLFEQLAARASPTAHRATLRRARYELPLPGAVRLGANPPLISMSCISMISTPACSGMWLMLSHAFGTGPSLPASRSMSPTLRRAWGVPCWTGRAPSWTGGSRRRCRLAAYFEDAVQTDGHRAGKPHAAAEGSLPLVISEMAVSSTGLGVFWELYESAACSSLGITPEFVNQVERVYNTCVVRAHLRWIRRLLQGRGMAVVSADVERVYLGDKRRYSTPTMAALPSLFRSLDFRVESCAGIRLARHPDRNGVEHPTSCPSRRLLHRHGRKPRSLLRAG